VNIDNGNEHEIYKLHKRDLAKIIIYDTNLNKIFSEWIYYLQYNISLDMINNNINISYKMDGADKYVDISLLYEIRNKINVLSCYYVEQLI
jgi:hypothetical protein